MIIATPTLTPTMKQRGIIVVVLSLAGMLIAFLLSTGWRSDLDFAANILHILRLQFIEGDSSYTYWIDVPTKYIFATFAASLAVGALMWFGVLGSADKPIERKESQNEQ